MLFSTPVFLFAFLPIVLAATLLAPRALRNAVLLLASLFFYAWGEPRVVLVMIVSIAVNWALGLGVGRLPPGGRARALIAIAVTFDLGLLVWFKYATFAVENLAPLLARLGGPVVELAPIALPIGISFFTFQAMSYVIDVYRRDGPAQRNPIDFGLYIALFPQLIAGPIVRYRHIAEQLRDRVISMPGFAEGVRRFTIGLAKKMLVANVVALPADRIFALPAEHLTLGTAWLGVLCYTAQIYFDFSGYSDMAIGLGRMFGFRLLENFRYPYVSRSITEFWRRWHISLSSWFRDYLYIPLGGNRGGPAKTYRNLVLVFLLCGLWHGASWSFVAWGLYHGVFLVLERRGLGAWIERWPRALGHAWTLLLVMVGWVFFRAETLTQAVGVLAAMAGASPEAAPGEHVGLYLDATVATALAAAVLGSTPWWPAIARRRDALVGAPRWALEGASVLTLSVLFVACAMMMAAGTHNPFIYFRF